MSTDSLTRALDGDQYEMNLSSPYSWRPVAILLAFQAALVALALSGLARADEPVSPTLRVLLSVPRHVSDLDEEDGTRAARLKAIASAIDAATPHAHERALLLAVGWHESRWASSVGSGDVLGDEGRARGYWQQWGLDESASLDEQASRALMLLRYHARRCGGPGLATVASVRAGVSGYATGGRLCRWSGAEKRVRTWRSVVARLGGGQ